MEGKLAVIRTATLAVGAGLGLMVLTTLAPTLMNDFVEYWTAGALNLSGQNPYDRSLVLKVEQAAGYAGDQAIMMLNPPVVLTILMPLSLLPYASAAVLWLVLHTAVLLYSCTVIWECAGGPRRTRWVAYLCGVAFVPSLLALFWGQISILMLLGLALFLRFERDGRMVAAGSSTAFLLVKPHVVYLVGFAVVAWWLRLRDWRFVGGAVVAVGTVVLVPLAFNPDVYVQYVEMIRTESLAHFSTSTLGTMLRIAVNDPSRFYLQFPPMVLGLAFLVMRLSRRWRGWDWGAEMPGLVVVSVATAAYGWLYDQVILLIAALPMFSLAIRAGGARLVGVTAFWTATGAVLFVQAYRGVDSFWYFWLPYAYLAVLIFCRPDFGEARASETGIEQGKGV